MAQQVPQIAIEAGAGGTQLRRYVYGLDRVSMTTAAGNFYYHYDGLGSVANVTDSAGAKQWTYAYEPFGAATATQVATDAPLNPMQFAGEYSDSELGQSYLRARQYDPSTGRFLQTDPRAPELSDPYVAAYVYADDLPTALVDPLGESSSLGRLWHDAGQVALGAGDAAISLGTGLSQLAELANNPYRMYVFERNLYSRIQAAYARGGMTAVMADAGGAALGAGEGIVDDFSNCLTGAGDLRDTSRACTKAFVTTATALYGGAEAVSAVRAGSVVSTELAAEAGGSAPALVGPAGDAAAAGLSRMERFRSLAEDGFDVGDQHFDIDQHVLNSLRKSGRRGITPEDMIDALGGAPSPAERGSVVYTNPTTGTRWFVNNLNDVVGVWPKGFK